MSDLVEATARRSRGAISCAALAMLGIACGSPTTYDAGAATDASGGSADAGPDAGGGGGDAGDGTDAGTDAGIDRCADVLCTPSAPCRVSTCDPATGTCVEREMDGLACDDGLACTTDDACMDGVCMGGTPAPDGTLCGVCGACVGGACGWRELGATGAEAGTATPISFAVDDLRIYVANSYAGLAGRASVTSRPLAGGSLTTLASGFTGYPTVTVAAGSVFFTRNGEVWSTLADGSTTAASIHAGSPAFSSITSDAVRLYLATGAAGDTVASMDFGGGTPTTLASGEASPGPLVTDGTRVYWIDAGDATLRSVSVGGGTPVTLATGTAPRDLAVDATRLYWTEPTTGEVLAVPIAGGATATIATGQVQPFGILVHDGVVYWTNYHGGSAGDVRSVPVAGGTIETTPGMRIAPLSLAQSGECIYLLSAGTGSVASASTR